MLQLACADSFHAIKEAIEALKVGHNLLRALTLKPEPSTDQVFVVSLNRSPSAFPSLCAELDSLRKQGVISKMPQAMKLELRKKLKLDVDALLAKVTGLVEGQKKVLSASQRGEEEVPADLDECSAMLQEMEDSKKRQIESLNEDMWSLIEAKETIRLLQQLKTQAEKFDPDNLLHAVSASSAGQTTSAVATADNETDDGGASASFVRDEKKRKVRQ